jgi:spore coat polysaccharide biosynthesis protein SpsF (cytidylyltransferase family)
MPTAYIKKMAKKHRISVEKSDRLWQKATAIVKKQGKSDYALITSIYQKMLGEGSFSEYLENEEQLND